MSLFKTAGTGLFGKSESVESGSIFGQKSTGSVFNQEEKVSILTTNKSSVSKYYNVPISKLGTARVIDVITNGAKMLEEKVNGKSVPVNLLSDYGLKDAGDVFDTSSEAYKLNADANRDVRQKHNYIFAVYFLDENGVCLQATNDGVPITHAIEIPSVLDGPIYIVDVFMFPNAEIDMRKVRSVLTLTPNTSLAVK